VSKQLGISRVVLGSMELVSSLVDKPRPFHCTCYLILLYSSVNAALSEADHERSRSTKYGYYIVDGSSVDALVETWGGEIKVEGKGRPVLCVRW
jgi:hypothetical protein